MNMEQLVEAYSWCIDYGFGEPPLLDCIMPGERLDNLSIPLSELTGDFRNSVWVNCDVRGCAFRCDLRGAVFIDCLTDHCEFPENDGAFRLVTSN